MKIARFAIFLTGMVGLAMGGIMSISNLQSQQEQAVIQTNESLKNQSQALVDHFFGMLDAAKNSSVNSALPYITHRAVVKLSQGVPSEIESINSNAVGANGTADVDLALEERVLKALKQNVSLNDLQISKVSLGTYAQNDVSSREGIFIATPVYKTTANGVDPTAIEKVNVLLIDPVKALAGLSKTTASDRNSYLISKDGRVLAHSLNAYVGTDLKKIGGLKETIENLFLGAQTGHVGRYQAVDGTKEQVAFVRAGTSPFAIASEQPMANPVLSAAWVTEQVNSGAARRSVGMAFILIAAALALFSAISFWLSRELKKQIATNTSARMNDEAVIEPNHFNELHIPNPNVNSNVNTSYNLTPPSAPVANSYQAASKIAPPSMGVGVNTKVELDYSEKSLEQATEAFVENRTQLVQARQESDEIARAMSTTRNIEKEFTSRIQNVYAIETIEKELVQAGSELSSSPVLYFRYHRRGQNLNLSAVAGSVQIPNYAHMQAYVRKDIEQQVETLANEGKVASITNYGPLSKLMVANLNIANYEAWTVTSDAEVSGESKLVGVMVVIHPNFKQQSRQVLAKILREAGNYLYAHQNKIKPRYLHPQNEIDLGLNKNV